MNGAFHRLQLLDDVQARPTVMEHVDCVLQVATGTLEPIDHLGMADVNAFDFHFRILPGGMRCAV